MPARPYRRSNGLRLNARTEANVHVTCIQSVHDGLATTYGNDVEVDAIFFSATARSPSIPVITPSGFPLRLLLLITSSTTTLELKATTAICVPAVVVIGVTSKVHPAIDAMLYPSVLVTIMPIVVLSAGAF